MDKFNPALKISLIYLLVSILWIAGSDRALLLLSLEPSTLTLMQSVKGWFFAVFTALLLYYLIHKDNAQKEQLRKEILERNEILKNTNERLLQEIEERKVVEENLLNTQKSLEAANKAKTQFLANMSHEIRTPMNGIMGMIQLLLLENIAPLHEEYLNLAMTSASSLTDIINDILDISRIELGAMQLNSTSFKLRDLVERINSMFSINARSKKVRMEYEIAPEVPEELIGDSNRLGQILINLIGNAVKFTDKGSIDTKIYVAGKSAGRIEICFAISDTGIGIDGKDYDKLFRSFSQLDDSKQKRYGGTGLGLAISKKLIEMMNGDISVASELGKGSTFTFTAWFDINNITENNENAENKALDTTEGDETQGAVHILVVEDNKVNQIITKELLEKRGYEVAVADNGLRALECLDKQNFGLIIMDIQMPEMDGLQATRAIRQRGDDTPIIAVTAYAMENDKKKCMDAGMNEYISKPFTVEELYSKVDEQLYSSF